MTKTNDQDRIDQKCINTIRFLSADAIQKAKSGHPGICLGAAPMAYLLWSRYLRHNPADPGWVDRDRFVLSAGHGSMLLYSLLHLTGYDLSLDELKAFRQWGSKTPGHPECNLTAGVEATTGPLGQGLSNGVGMALAEAHLAARYNRPGHDIVDHHTYVIAGDGCLMEGVSAEACSLAGHLGLGKLIILYDSNLISLAGSTSLTFTEDVAKRYQAYGWQVLRVDDGNDLTAINGAIQDAREESNRPSLIMVRTIIGYGAPHKKGTFGAHGSPLGEEEIAEAKKLLDWPAEPKFLVPGDVLTYFRRALKRGEDWEAEWRASFDRYAADYPEPADEFNRVFSGKLPRGWDSDLPVFPRGSSLIATRSASEEVMQALARHLPELMGGSADLNPSCKTTLKGFGDFQSPLTAERDSQGAIGERWSYEGNNIHFGVREHAMGSIAVGMALHGGVLPYTATFLVFSDYMRPAIRMAALSEQHVIFVFTHDSIGLGEDGPTHQPVEQLMALRTIPNLTVIRPADAAETVEAWRVAVEAREEPVALIFTRQSVPVIDRDRGAPAAGLRRGGYILWKSSDEPPDVILIGTGSELEIARAAGKELAAEGIRVRVVSLPSWELFDRQPREYRESVLPPEVKARVAVEAGVTTGWEHYVGLSGRTVGLDRFGASAPAPVLYEKFGITPEAVVKLARKVMRK
ncbi:MAG: transketolase [Candidatus Euphemobacter frigidus]|nr:transketolase [Candidatus Euphemobacter frigidus]MDP8276318.1 transketolase [Candidatus Euphemobacter frigidus]